MVYGGKPKLGKATQMGYVCVCVHACMCSVIFAQPRSRTVAWEARTSIESYIPDHRKLEKEQIVSECRRWQESGFQTGELKREIP